MKPIEDKIFKQICDDNGIVIPDGKLGIGKDIHFDRGPLRTLVIYFGKEDYPDYLCNILTIIMDLDDSWLLIPRFFIPTVFKINDQYNRYSSFSFEKQEFELLIDTLAKYRSDLCCISDDIYLLSHCGKIILKYDHHFQNDGLAVFINDIEISNKLLLSLNKIDTELELFYVNREQKKALGPGYNVP